MSSAVLCRPAPSTLPRAGTVPLLPVVGAGTRVPLVPGGSTRYVDLDSAASSRPPVSVAERVAEALEGRGRWQPADDPRALPGAAAKGAGCGSVDPR